jgi:hypothetical protein
MSILISCNAARIESVALTGFSVAERAIEGAVYRAIAPLIDKLDNELRRLNDEVLRGLRDEKGES